MGQGKSSEKPHGRFFSGRGNERRGGETLSGITDVGQDQERGQSSAGKTDSNTLSESSKKKKKKRERPSAKLRKGTSPP